jgi:hypothetical protein
MNIDFFGLDMYIVSELSPMIENRIATLLKLNKDDIIVTATEATLLHQGVDQNAWQTIIRFRLLRTLQPLQKTIADEVYKIIKPHTIHVSMTFEYMETFHEVNYIAKDYPRFVTETNQVDMVTSESTPTQDIFNGNAFAPHQSKIDKIEAESDCENGICEGEEEDKVH